MLYVARNATIDPPSLRISDVAAQLDLEARRMESVPEEMHDTQIAPLDERQEDDSEHVSIEEDNTNKVGGEQLHNQETDMDELDNMLTVPTSDSSTISPMFSFANEYLRVNHIAIPPFFLLPSQHQGALS